MKNLIDAIMYECSYQIYLHLHPDASRLQCLQFLFRDLAPELLRRGYGVGRRT